MTLPRSFRPRLLLLPLVLGVLVLPGLLTTTTVPAAEHEMRAGSMCSNVEKTEPRREPDKSPSGPTCVNCRAPLINAPLAQVDRAAISDEGDAPPAA